MTRLRTACPIPSPTTPYRMRTPTLRSYARVAEASFPSLAPGKLVHFLPRHARHRRHDHLRDPLSPGDGHRVLAEIDEDHLHGPPEICVDRARGVHHPDAMAGGQAA